MIMDTIISVNGYRDYLYQWILLSLSVDTESTCCIVHYIKCYHKMLMWIFFILLYFQTFSVQQVSWHLFIFQYHKHLFVHIGASATYSDPMLEVCVTTLINLLLLYGFKRLLTNCQMTTSS